MTTTTRGLAPLRRRESGAGAARLHSEARQRRCRSRERSREAAITLAYRAAAVDAAIHLSALVFAVAPPELREAGRGQPEVARARQVAMYLAHVAFSIPQVDVGEAFGRDRTTVVWACRRVEDDRDDTAFDCVMVRMEAMLDAVRDGLERCAAYGRMPEFGTVVALEAVR